MSNNRLNGLAMLFAHTERSNPVTLDMENIVDEFDKTHGITIDKKKIHVSSEINSVGIYNVNVKLSKDIMASFDLKIVDQKG